MLTGGLSYDHKFSVSGKPIKDELVRTPPRARVPQRAKTGEHMVARLKDDDASVRRAALAALCSKRPGEGMGGE